jgi:hypothetical protein
MSETSGSEIAEAVGHRVLQWKGAEFLELIYLLDERNTLELLRLFVTLSEDAKKDVVNFLNSINGRERVKLRVDDSGLHIEEE